MTTVQAVTTWYPEGPAESGGDCGGDVQASDSFLVTYWNDTLPVAVVDVTTYAAEYADTKPGVFWVQVQVVWWLCGDRRHPGTTETWSDHRHFDVSEHPTAEAAAEAASALAEALVAGGSDDVLAELDEEARDLIFRWDGDPTPLADLISVCAS